MAALPIDSPMWRLDAGGRSSARGENARPVSPGDLVAIPNQEGHLMQFLLLTYNAPDAREVWAAMTESERRAEEDEYLWLVEAMRESHAYIAANELDPHTTPQTVRVRNGIPSVTDGPAVQSEEQLTGYFLIEVESADAASAWAAKIPNARNGSVEVRRVDEGELAKRIAATGRGR